MRAVVVLLLWSSTVLAQPRRLAPLAVVPADSQLLARLDLLLPASGPAPDHREGLLAFCRKLEKERSKFSGDESFLRHVFQRVGQDYYQRFVAYQPFSQLLESGVYNCVSGTALHFIILERLGFLPIIRETTTHSYLLVALPHRTLLIETTDPANGILVDPMHIWVREQRYANGRPAASISLENLQGLALFNQGLVCYQRKDFAATRSLLGAAAQLYPASERITTLQHWLAGRSEREPGATGVAASE